VDLLFILALLLLYGVTHALIGACARLRSGP